MESLRNSAVEGFCGSGWNVRAEELACPLDGETQPERAEWFPSRNTSENPHAAGDLVRTFCSACGGRHHDFNF